MNEKIKHETKSTEKIIGKIVEKISNKFKIKTIFLFGSFAKEIPVKDSDIDLCIISNEQKRQLDLIREIRLELKDSVYPLDILVYSEDEFNERIKSNTSFEHTIHAEGIKLYGE